MKEWVGAAIGGGLIVTSLAGMGGYAAMHGSLFPTPRAVAPPPRVVAPPLFSAPPRFPSPPPRQAVAQVQPTAARNLTADRARHPTRLTRLGPSPQVTHPGEDDVPDGVAEVQYPSGNLQLRAWVGRPDGDDGTGTDGVRRPAVVFCHGGFALGTTDWTEDAVVFAKAGFVTMVPAVRGENGNPGHFECYRGEVDDANAAGRWLAKQPGVDPARLYVCGHSAGGALAALAIETDETPFKAAAPIGAEVDLAADLKRWPNLPQFAAIDTGDPDELLVRSAVNYTASLRRPVLLLAGTEDAALPGNRLFAARARRQGKTCDLVVVPGDHMGAKPDALGRAAAYFQQLGR